MQRFIKKAIQLNFIGSIFIFISSPLYPLPAEDVEIVNDRDYFPRVHELLREARKSIFVVMYSVHYYDKYPDSPSNVLLTDLAEARKRGVDVRVVLEGEELPGRVGQFLKYHMVPYKLDSPDVTTHAKLIIIDGIYTVIGSTNWSYSALSKNHETAVVIRSQPTAAAYIEYFNKNLKKK